MSHRIAVMEAGHVVETGTVEQIFDDPRRPYTPAAARGGAPPAGVERAARAQASA